MREILCFLVQAFLIAILVRIVFSWIRPAPGGALDQVSRVADAITEPVLGPVRRAMPMARIGNVGLDLSSLVVVLVIQLLVAPIVCG